MIDMDHAATTVLCDEAAAAMEPFLEADGGAGRYGNPSGSHRIARDALRALDAARESVAEVLGCRPGEVVFTSGGTEADNHAVTGGMPPRRGVPVCSAVEHPAVLDPVLALGGVVVPVDRLGRIDLAALADTLGVLTASDGPGPSVVSVMSANNELGTINDLVAVAAVIDEHAPGVVLHTDAVQAAPWLDLGVTASRAELVSVSAHKLGGPKGTGALVVRGSTRVDPLLRGGGQERDRRGGTHNVAGIVGFAAALAATAAQRTSRVQGTARRRDRLADALTSGNGTSGNGTSGNGTSGNGTSSIGGVAETVGPEVAAACGAPANRSHLLPGHCHLLVEGVGGEELLLVLERQGVCASAASSCASGAVGSSHVMDAVGVAEKDEEAGSVQSAPLRLSLGVDTTDADVDGTEDAMVAAVEHIRARRGRAPG